MREFLTIAGMQRMGLIKSLQRVTLTVPAAVASGPGTVTINAVDRNNTILVINDHQDATADSTAGQCCALVTFTNDTTISGTRQLDASGTNIFEIFVVEFQRGVLRSVQRGTYSTVSTTNNTATINAVDVNKSIVFTLHFNSSYGSVNVPGLTHLKQSLSSATQVFGVGLGSINRTIGYLVAEFNG